MNNDSFFASFTRTAWRLETLPAYGTPESDPDFAAFLALGHLTPLAERPRKQRWMADVQAAVATGKQLGRVHVLGQPLSDYLRYELAAYPENAAAGEVIRIADVTPMRHHASLRRDFWLLDDEAVMLMDYDEHGRFLGVSTTHDRAVVRRYRHQQEKAIACSVKLEEYLQPA